MKRVILTLLVILLAGVAAFFITRRCLVPATPSSWICREYGLPASEEERLRDLERSYGSRCGSFCDAMCDATARLETLAPKHGWPCSIIFMLWRHNCLLASAGTIC